MNQTLAKIVDGACDASRVDSASIGRREQIEAAATTTSRVEMTDVFVLVNLKQTRNKEEHVVPTRIRSTHKSQQYTVQGEISRAFGASQSQEITDDKPPKKQSCNVPITSHRTEVRALAGDHCTLGCRVANSSTRKDTRASWKRLRTSAKDLAYHRSDWQRGSGTR